MTEFRIKRLGRKGEGIADGPEGDIFVPFTLPDETVTGEIVGDQLIDPKIVDPSEHRVTAPCSHFRKCGGCTLQHASEQFLALWKTEIVSKALAAHSLSAPLLQPIVSPQNSRRRATFSGRRTKKGALVGFHARSSETIISIPNCKLLEPDLVSAIPLLEALTILGASRSSEISLHVTQSLCGLDIDVSGAKPADGPLLVDLGRLAQQFSLARLGWNGEIIVLQNPPEQKFGGVKVTPPAGAFLQATLAGQNALTDAVRKIVADSKHIVDLFAGCGTFSLPLSQTARVHAVEGAQDHMDVLAKAARQTGGALAVTTETRDLFRRPLLVSELAVFDSVVIDPPRAGAKAQTAELAKSPVSTVAYVSCSPVTFARDAAVLCDAGFSIDWVQVVDQFRWSPHIELVAKITRS